MDGPGRRKLKFAGVRASCFGRDECQSHGGYGWTEYRLKLTAGQVRYVCHNLNINIYTSYSPYFLILSKYVVETNNVVSVYIC